MDQALIGLWAERNLGVIAEKMGITVDRVSRRAKHLGLPKFKVKQRENAKAAWRRRRWPSKEAWTEIAAEKAALCRVSPREVLCGALRRPAVHARWYAFQALFQRHPHVSLYGAAKISGFDHTAIMHGLKRLKQLEAA